MNLQELAAKAYDAYGGVTNYKNFQGNPMPKWEDLPDTIKIAWITAVATVVEQTHGRLRA